MKLNPIEVETLRTFLSHLDIESDVSLFPVIDLKSKMRKIVDKINAEPRAGDLFSGLTMGTDDEGLEEIQKVAGKRVVTHIPPDSTTAPEMVDALLDGETFDQTISVSIPVPDGFDNHIVFALPKSLLNADPENLSLPQQGFSTLLSAIDWIMYQLTQPDRVKIIIFLKQKYLL